MGVFETLASLCEPRDLTAIREGMRAFLSTTGQGGADELARMEQAARKLMPFEMRYLPALHAELAEELSCRSLALFAQADSRLVPLVAAALGVRRLLLLHTAGGEAERARTIQYLQSFRFDVVVTPLRGEPLHPVALRCLSRLREDPASRPVAFFPGDAPTSVAVVVADAARRAGLPVVCAQTENYGGVLRPFSLRLCRLEDEVNAPEEKKREEPSAPEAPRHRDTPSPGAAEPPQDYHVLSQRSGAAMAEFLSSTEPGTALESVHGMRVPTDDLAKLLVSAFNGRNYSAALRIAGHVGNYEDALARFRVTAESLVEFVRIYADWDRFRHSPIEDNPGRKLHERLMLTWQRLGKARDHVVSDADLSRNTAFLRQLDESWAPGGRLVGDPGRAVDMFAAAVRRRSRGLSEEAARFCLRSMEMAAAHVLQQPPFAIGDPHQPRLEGVWRVLGGSLDTNTAVDQVLRAWGMGESMPGRAAPLSLVVLMAILRAVGEVYREGPALAMGTRFGELMTETVGREPLHAHLVRTLVAGGTAPLPAESGEKLERATREIVSRSMGLDAFRERMAGATHTSLRVPPN